MDLFLQIWGGGLYLLNKVFFALAEGRRKNTQRWLRIVGWSVYILGVPAWVIILVDKHNWIAASIEAGGIPAMLLGLFNAYHNAVVHNKVFDTITASFTYTMATFGVCYSLYDYGGIVSVSQLLEMGVMIGFLLGSYLLAKNNLYGWLLFMLMNGSMASLMFLQQKPILSFQQLVSLSFVIYGFTIALHTSKRRS